jgi:probable F420-dependent oxidoreductase
MKIGIQLQVGPRRWVELTQAAEQAGFESVWIPEHLIMPVKMSGHPGTPHEGDSPISGDVPAWDPWMEIAYLAGLTTTIRFGTNVFNIGLRHPFITARSLTTADLISKGRIEFGIGASWLAEEWEAMELPFESRGRRVDETIGIIKRLFTEEVIEHEGEFFKFQPVKFLPKPVQAPWPPMHIGGDSPAAMRRAARLGDGWLPMAQTFETLPVNLKRIAAMRAEAGRDQPFQVSLSCHEPLGADVLRRYADLGVGRVILVPWTNPRESIDAIRRFGDEVLPLLENH